MNLGKELIKDGLITAEQLKIALERQVVFGGKIGTNLIEMGILTEEQMTHFLGKYHNMPVVDSGELSSIESSVIGKINRTIAEKYKIIPFKKEDNKIHVAMLMTEESRPLNKIKTLAGMVIVQYIAPEFILLDALERYYGVKTNLPSDIRIDLDDPEDFKNGSSDSLMAVKKTFVAVNKSEQIASILISEAKKVAKRVAVFQVKGNIIVGWKSDCLDIEGFKTKAVSGSILGNTLTTRTYYRGAVHRIPENDDLLFLTSGPTRDSLTVPIILSGKVIAILYADNGNSEVMDATLAYINTLARLASCAFELLDVKKKILTL